MPSLATIGMGVIVPAVVGVILVKIVGTIVVIIAGPSELASVIAFVVAADACKLEESIIIPLN